MRESLLRPGVRGLLHAQKLLPRLPCWSPGSYRNFSDNKDDFEVDAETEEFIHRSLAPEEPDKNKAKVENTPGILTTRREALSLFRSILRSSRLFVWHDDHGVPWRDVIRYSSRKEFEAARFETDPEMISRLILAGWHYKEKALQMFMARREKIMQQDEIALSNGTYDPVNFSHHRNMPQNNPDPYDPSHPIHAANSPHSPSSPLHPTNPSSPYYNPYLTSPTPPGSTGNLPK